MSSWKELPHDHRPAHLGSTRKEPAFLWRVYRHSPAWPDPWGGDHRRRCLAARIRRHHGEISRCTAPIQGPLLSRPGPRQGAADRVQPAVGLARRTYYAGCTRADVPEINVLSNATPDGKPSGKHPDPTAKRWHTDRSYMPRPAMTTLLYGVEVPSVGGDTLFANATMAYEALPEETRNRIDKLNAIHWVVHSRRDGGVAPRPPSEEKRKGPTDAPSARAPASGDRQEGDLLRLPCLEGRGLGRGRGPSADRLSDRLRGPGPLRLRAQVAPTRSRQWDNRCIFHAATDYDTAKELRVLYRTVIEGEPTVPVLRDQGTNWPRSANGHGARGDLQVRSREEASMNVIVGIPTASPRPAAAVRHRAASRPSP